MGKYTSIQWCDSAVNPVMGCDGCELYEPARPGMTPERVASLVRTCYAGVLHEMRGGKVKGYAADFLTPEMFPGRMAAAAKWGDLTGKDRVEIRKGDEIKEDAKPWLNGRPRHVFISDMGDALSRAIPFEYLLAEVVNVVANWPHVGMWLTKQPGRMAEFSNWLEARGVAWPANLWAGTSITQHGQGARLRQLRKVRAATRFVSIEPIVDDPGDLDFGGIALAILGGESGRGARATDVATVRALLGRVDAAGAAAFVKQLGAYVVTRNDDGLSGGDEGDWNLADPVGQVEHDLDGTRDGYQGAPVRVHLKNRKGDEMDEWPADIQRREFPAVRP